MIFHYCRLVELFLLVRSEDWISSLVAQTYKKIMRQYSEISHSTLPLNLRSPQSSLSTPSSLNLFVYVGKNDMFVSLVKVQK